MDRVRHERDRFVESTLHGVERIAQADRTHGHVIFVDNHTLAVGDHTRVTAKSVDGDTGKVGAIENSALQGPCF